MKDKKRVLIYDSQFLTRTGFALLVEGLPDFEMVGQVANADFLEKSMNELHPDVVVLGIIDNEDELIRQLADRSDKRMISYLIITGVYKKLTVQKLLNTGVKGILTKTCSEEEIIHGLRAVSEKNRFYCNKILDMMMNQNNDASDCDPTALSEREYEVLELIANGYKTTQIADQLFLSVHTVNSHRKNILKKLNVKSPTELVVYALETGLVTPKKEFTG